MQRSAVLSGALAALATLPLPAAAADAAVRIAVVGDSLALGTGASRADGGFIFRAYRRVLAQRPGSRIDNVAIGGATVADVLRLQIARLDGIRYDAVIVCIGGNDVVRFTTPATFARTYARLLHAIAVAVPHARIVCCGVPDVSVSPIFSSERGLIRTLAVDDDRAVRHAAQPAGATFVDLFGVSTRQVDPARFLGRDRFHPSDRGYALLEAVLTPALERALPRER
jgi:acyl-CoA thioesterase-1